VTVNGNSLRVRAESNSLAGTFDTAALLASNVDDFSFRSNIVEGSGATVSGIRLAGTAVNGTVERNVVNDVGNALFLLTPALPALTVSLRLNDFTGYLTAIRTSNFFSSQFDLAGNYWGLPCPGLDPGLVRYENGLVNPFVTDSRAYGVPVARTRTAQLPAPCQ
jgi:hypothetical protein